MNHISRHIFHKFILPVVNFYLYSSLHIAICAAILTWFTQSALGIDIHWEYVFFVFCSTLFLYAVHRIIGIWKSPQYNVIGRFAIISKYKHHLILYSILSGLGALYYFMQLGRSIQIELIIPCLLSIAYSLPIFGKRRRLRDFHYVKIFTIAICWAWITAIIPTMESLSISHSILIGCSRALFIFAITIPFDIRDHKIDTEVKTLASDINYNTLKTLAVACLCMSVLLNYILFGQMPFIAETISLAIAALLVIKTHTDRSDYYYTGLIDGTIGLSGLIYLMTICL